ncbi:MAG: hypothetical protein ACP5XB_16060 [Isosphaeraceae bacterium]
MKIHQFQEQACNEDPIAGRNPHDHIGPDEHSGGGTVHYNDPAGFLHTPFRMLSELLPDLARLFGAIPRLTIGEAWLNIIFMDVKQIEAAILELDAENLTEFTAWLKEHRAQLWDMQIAEDLESGRLDGLLAQVDKEYEAGLARPL